MTGAAVHWSTYWARGVLTSLPEDFPANYDGEIAGFWHGIFADLPQSATMLDACTGNGALALLAAEFASANQRELSISAVDAATIDPVRAASSDKHLKHLLEKIRFTGRTPIEEFEAEPGSFDLIGSQYGLEYCEPETVASSLVKMLKPDGRLVLVTHALGSDMLKTMNSEAKEYKRFDELRIGVLLRSWLSGQLASADFKRRLHQAGERLMVDYRQNQSPLYRYVLTMVRHVANCDEPALKRSRPALEDAARQLDSGRARLEDMLAANERTAAPDWYQPYLDAGLTLTDSGLLRYKMRHHVGNYYAFARST